MKTKEELFALRNEVELLNTKLCELSDDELAQVTGGISDFAFCARVAALGTARFEPGKALLDDKTRFDID